MYNFSVSLSLKSKKVLAFSTMIYLLETIHGECLVFDATRVYNVTLTMEPNVPTLFIMHL